MSTQNPLPFLCLCAQLFMSLEAQTYLIPTGRRAGLTVEKAESSEVIFPMRYSRQFFAGHSHIGNQIEQLQCYKKECSYILNTRRARYHIRLRKNRVLAPADAKFTVFSKSYGLDNLVEQNLKECLYHGEVVGRSRSSVALSTCNGLSGTVILERNIYMISPVKHRVSTTLSSHPHLFIRLRNDYESFCVPRERGRNQSSNPTYVLEHLVNNNEARVCRKIKGHNLKKYRTLRGRSRYLELSVLVDKEMIEWKNVSNTDLFRYLLDCVNTLDLFLRQINVRVSLVHVELWTQENRIDVTSDDVSTLENLVKFSMNNSDDTAHDVTFLLTVSGENTSQIAVYPKSVCTVNATGLIRAILKDHPVYISLLMTHGIGHILGLRHENSDKRNAEKDFLSIMGTPCRINNARRDKYRRAYLFTECTKHEFTRLLNSNQADCLFNMPLQRNTSALCGNKKIDKNEECDCGNEDECESIDPCCDFMSCKLKRGAQCSQGPCCEKCKFVSSGKLCRPGKDADCDFPEFCEAFNEARCPADAYKPDGTACGDNKDRYCYNGKCVDADERCRKISSEFMMADDFCYRKYNLVGSNVGRCSLDLSMKRVACTDKNYQCGMLICKRKVHLQGTGLPRDLNFTKDTNAFNCSNAVLLNFTLVEDGTKCGSNGLCEEQACVSADTMLKRVSCSGEDEESSLPCNGHGTCTNLNTCSCDEGWEGSDCSFMSEDPKAGNDSVPFPTWDYESDCETAYTTWIMFGVSMWLFVSLTLIVVTFRKRFQNLYQAVDLVSTSRDEHSTVTTYRRRTYPAPMQPPNIFTLAELANEPQENVT